MKDENDASGLQAGARGRPRHRRRRGRAIHPADEGDPTTLSRRWRRRAQPRRGWAGGEEEPCVVVADKGYHSREQLKALEGGVGRRASPNRAVQGLPALAWRRGGAQSGLRQSRAAEIGYRARDDAPARRNGRALLRPCPRSRRHASSMAARTGEPPQALPDPCRRVQSRRLDARLYGRERRGRLRRRIRLIFVLQSDAALAFGLIPT